MSQALNIIQFAQLAAITPQAARKAARAGQWRGHRLIVRVENSRGGTGGTRYLVRLDSLPPDVQARARDLWSDLAGSGSGGTISTAALPGPADDDAGAAPVAAKRRRLLMREDAGKPRMPWCLNAAVKRGLIGRDQALGIARLGRDYARDVSACAIGTTGWRLIARATTTELQRLCLEAGIPAAEALKIRATRAFVDDPDVRDFRALNTYRNDAKRFADTQPAVTRDYSMLDHPLQLLVGDGTPLDILHRRPDGSVQKIALLLLEDAKTRRMFWNAYVRPKGEGVRQEHTALSFAALAVAIGLPDELYLDNGSEYKWAERLGDLVKVTRARPYAARSKMIESALGIVQRQYIATIQGYIGPDRTDAKSPNVGKRPEPFRGSLGELMDEIGRKFAVYNATRKPALGDISPNDAWQKAVDAGWQPNRVSMETMTEGLAEPKARVVQKGAIKIANVTYTSDELMHNRLEGKKVTAFVPLEPGFPVSVIDHTGRFVSLVHPQEAYHPTDRGGAREATRIKSIRNGSAREMARTVRPVDVEEIDRRFLERNPPPDEPTGGNVVELDDARGHAVNARLQLPDRRPEAPALAAPGGDDNSYAAMDDQFAAELAPDLEELKAMQRKFDAEDEARRRAAEDEEAEDEEEELRARAREMTGGKRSVPC